MVDAVPARRKTLVQLCATILATGFGSGYAPIAPGTAGSLVGLLLFWPMAGFAPHWILSATVLVFFLGVAAATRVARGVGLEDPGIVVVDEIVGMWISLLFVPFTPACIACAFVLFRAMDVVKPYPARDFERLPGGWGIMADDVMAGIYANLALRVALLVWPLA